MENQIERPLKKYWYIACYWVPDNPPLFARRMIEALDLEDVYTLGGRWFDKTFPQDDLINDYAFLAEDYEGFVN